MCIGHVDVKFSLHPSCQLVPNIQVTLLRLKKSNYGILCEQESHRTENMVDDDCLSFASSSKNTSSGSWALYIRLQKFVSVFLVG